MPSRFQPPYSVSSSAVSCASSTRTVAPELREHLLDAALGHRRRPLGRAVGRERLLGQRDAHLPLRRGVFLPLLLRMQQITTEQQDQQRKRHGEIFRLRPSLSALLLPLELMIRVIRVMRGQHVNSEVTFEVSPDDVMVVGVVLDVVVLDQEALALNPVVVAVAEPLLRRSHPGETDGAQGRRCEPWQDGEPRSPAAVTRRVLRSTTSAAPVALASSTRR